MKTIKFIAVLTLCLLFTQKSFALTFQDLKTFLMPSPNISERDIDRIVKKFIPKSSEIFFGDIRIRNQIENTVVDSEYKNTYKLRVRAGIKPRINPFLTAGLGLSTGSGDPRSLNLTLGKTFAYSPVYLNYAYFNLELFQSYLTVGKMQNPIWNTTDMLWDSDIHPEGICFQIPGKDGSSFNFFSSGGIYLLDTINSKESPALSFLQPGISFKLLQNTHVKTAATVYLCNQVKSKNFIYSSLTNSTENSILLNNYSAVSASAIFQIYSIPLVNHLSLFADGIINTTLQTDNKGLIGGLSIGEPTASDLGEWTLKYTYRILQKDAWLDVFPDSDAYFGKTDIKGSEISLNIVLFPDLVTSLDYYFLERISDPTQKNTTLQIDFTTKF